MAITGSGSATMGDAIRRLRRDRNVSQRGLGALVGRSQQWVGKVEANQIAPSFEMVARIARALGTSPSALCADVWGDVA